jgi:hypothetical protein
MKIKKTTYCPKSLVPRGKLANSFTNESINARLIKSKAIDTKENQKWIDLGKGYFKSEIMDKKKRIK